MARIAASDRFHYTEKQWNAMIDSKIAKALAEKTITADDVKLIRAFIDSRRAANVANSSIYKYVRTIVDFRAVLRVQYRDATKKDLMNAKNAIDGAVNSEGMLRSRNYARDSIEIVKAFFRFGLDEDEEVWSQISEASLKKIKAVKSVRKTKTIDDIMTADEVRRCIDAAKNSRDRAMMAIQYECALRAVEIGRLRWGDITWTGAHEASIKVTEKTDVERHISIVLYHGYLMAWKRDSLNANDKNGFVFVTNGYNRRGTQISYNVVHDVVKDAAARAGITGRKTSPHTLRHSRITYWLQHDVPMAKICLMAWGTEYSPMIKTYSHLGNDEAAKEQRRLAGLKDSDIIQTGEIRLEDCPVCGHKSAPGSEHCAGCGAALKEDAAAKVAAKTDKLAAVEAENADLRARMAKMENMMAEFFASQKKA